MSDEPLYQVNICRHKMFGICDACKLHDAGLVDVDEALTVLGRQSEVIKRLVAALDRAHGRTGHSNWCSCSMCEEVRSALAFAGEGNDATS